MMTSTRLNSLSVQKSYDYFALQTQNVLKAVIDSNSYGYFNHIIHNHFKTPGKMIRPYLVYKLGSLLKVDTSDLLPWATACEILHNATLIHDDIQDRDTHRRGQLTLWTQFGDEQAINAGDFLLMSALQPILISTIKAETKVNLSLLFSKMACKIVDGQSLEFELNSLHIPELLYNKYMDCITMKTAALFSDLAVGVNILATESSLNHEDVHELFSKIGILFQIQDDILDLYGDKQRDTIGCDLKEGKISFLIVTHTKHHPKDFEIIVPILKKPRALTTINDIKKIKNLFDDKGTHKKCISTLNTLKQEILTSPIVDLNPKLKKLIVDLVNKITVNIKT